jgi:hypothetical protein
MNATLKAPPSTDRVRLARQATFAAEKARKRAEKMRKAVRSQFNPIRGLDKLTKE